MLLNSSQPKLQNSRLLHSFRALEAQWGNKGLVESVRRQLPLAEVQIGQFHSSFCSVREEGNENPKMLIFRAERRDFKGRYVQEQPFPKPADTHIGDIAKILDQLDVSQVAYKRAYLIRHNSVLRNARIGFFLMGGMIFGSLLSSSPITLALGLAVGTASTAGLLITSGRVLQHFLAARKMAKLESSFLCAFVQAAVDATRPLIESTQAGINALAGKS